MPGRVRLPEHVDAYRLLAESLQQQVTYLQEQNALLTARIAEIASPGANARMAWKPTEATPTERKVSPPLRYSPSAFAARVDVMPPQDALPESVVQKVAAAGAADIEESFRR